MKLLEEAVGVDLQAQDLGKLLDSGLAAGRRWTIRVEVS
jgi:hypothetical protein